MYFIGSLGRYVHALIFNNMSEPQGKPIIGNRSDEVSMFVRVEAVLFLTLLVNSIVGLLAIISFIIKNSATPLLLPLEASGLLTGVF